MSGHSKWSTIKHKKAANDKKRGKIFTKVIRELTIASKMGGSDPEANPRLRIAIQKAKDVNMPKDTLERAIKKGAGELDDVSYDEFSYEGYAPEGVAIFMDIMTDNKNRTASDVRSTLTKAGGNLGANGCVAFMFDKKGILLFDEKVCSEEEAMEIGIDAGAEDIQVDDGTVEVITSPADYLSVIQAFEDAGKERLSGEITMIPNSYQEVPADKVDKILRCIDNLEDLDDVQNVYTNLKLPDDYEVE